MILDGGLGVELAARGFVYATTLWSGEAVLERPDLLVDVHRAYLAAGAHVIGTATYQLSHAALRELGYDDTGVDAVFARAVALAREAITAHRAQTGRAAALLVAGSLGPHGATRADGSEYSSAAHLDPDALYAFHRQRVLSIARAAPDLVYFETIPSAAEARVICAVARDLDLRRVWLSLSCADGAFTCGGDRVADIVAEIDSFDAIEAVGVNCTAPGAIASLVRAMKSATAKPIVVCPNLEPERHGRAGGSVEAELASRVREWLALGVSHIGGCCGAGPQAIGAIARAAASA